jgi:FkbM family methyltransferase
MWPLTTRLLGRTYSTIVSRNGYKIRVDLKDQLNRMVLFFGESVRFLWEPQTTKVALHFMKNSENAVVAGSHIGYINLELLQALSNTGKIFTFEPAAYLFERSKENIALNSAESKIKLFHEALSDKDGSVQIYVEDLRTSIVPYSAAHSVNHRVEEVPATTLAALKDREKISRIDFLFLDVEGFEYQVLTGAKEIIRQDKPTIIFEVSEKILKATKITSDMLYDFLGSLGYVLYVIDDNYELNNVLGWDKKPVDLVPVKNWTKKTSYINVLAVVDPKMIESFR